MKLNRHLTLLRVWCLLVFFLFCNPLICLLAQGQDSIRVDSTTTTTQQSRKVQGPTKIFLIKANTLEFDKSQKADVQVLRGDVVFRQDSAYMYCDSAYFYQGTNSLDAFSNVRMEQGDTLFVYGDVLYYDGNTGLARLRDNVKMINRDVTLETDSLNYDRATNIGYYFDGGEIIDKENHLSSTYGQYSPDTEVAVFQYNVELNNPQYTLYSDTLRYNTNTGIADILGESVILSDSNTIYSNLGWYNTQTDESMLLNQSKLVSKAQVLTGDTIFYNRRSGFGEIFGDMVMNDSVRKIILQGEYGFYNEITEDAYVTDEALAIEYSTPDDSLFLHADTLNSLVKGEDRLLSAYYGVRFFREDAQGVCDSLRYSSADSLLVMYKSPILWNQNYQIYGDTIFVSMNDSTIEHLLIKDFAFLCQYKTDEYYDQLTGKVMNAYFTDGELSQMQMDGNVETIFFPEEETKALIGLNSATSSYLRATFENRTINTLTMWPKVTGSLTPLPKLSKDKLYLGNFRWYKDLRPTNKYDIFKTVEMKAEDKVENTRLFTTEELEGNIEFPELK